MKSSPIGHRGLRAATAQLGLRGAFALLLAVATRTAGGDASRSPASDAQPLAARVLWLDGDRLYLASRDSVAIEPGVRLTITKRGKLVATARIERVVDGHLITARALSAESGALQNPKGLEVRVEAISPATRTSLRVGIPGVERAHPLASCAGDSLTLPAAIAGWRAEAAGGPELRLVRPPGGAADGATRWPDTLRVVRFAEATDEEIAIERGELDVGVFWPGELSAAMRQRPMGAELQFGTRAHEGLAVTLDPSDSLTVAPDATQLPAGAINRLNRDRFRGDLEPLIPESSNTASAADKSADMPAPIRFRVDPAVLHHAEIERTLNSQASAPGGPGTRTLRVSLIDPAHSRGATPVLGVRCTVVSAPGIGTLVRALGLDAFAELPGCGPAAAP